MQLTRETADVIFDGNVINRRPVASTTLSVVNSGDFLKFITFLSTVIDICLLPHAQLILKQIYI